MWILNTLEGVTSHVYFLLQLSLLFPRMANLVDVTRTVCQAPISPTVLTAVLLTAAVEVGATMKWEVLSYMLIVWL